MLLHSQGDNERIQKKPLIIVIGWQSPGPPHSKYCCWQSVRLLSKRKQPC